MPTRYPFILLLSHLGVLSGARILAVLPTASPSHHIWKTSLLTALAARGHHLTVLSPDPQPTKVSNLTDVLIEGAYQHAATAFNYQEMNDISATRSQRFVLQWGQTMCAHNIATEGAQTLIKSTEKFDLIIFEIGLEECFLGFVHKFGYPPVLGVTAYGSPKWASDILGNPDNPAYMPHFLLPLTHGMSLIERVCNFLLNGYTAYYRRVHHMPYMHSLARGHFGESLPSLIEIEGKISVIMVNTHFSMDYPRPLLPGMVEVGGLHIKTPETLPQELQTYLDEAKDGVIFFSLGSNLRSDQLGSEKINAFLDAFKDLPQRVLWKWESDTLPGQPDNVKLGKWFPQNDILAHPHVLLFITHAGLLSTQEAVHHGVPVVAIPVFSDQHRHAHCAVFHGVGEKLDFSGISKEGIVSALRQVITSPSYRENARRLSARFRDRPQSPLELAVFWTEYVIRHKGTPHLRSAALDLTWYQYLLLDVVGVLLLAVGLGLAAVWMAVSAVLTFRTRTRHPKTKQN